jgi:hypothetical protein
MARFRASQQYKREGSPLLPPTRLYFFAASDSETILDS